MGLPERDIVEAIEHAREAVEAATNDEESWFDRLMACASRGFEHTNDHALYDEYRATLFIMMQELVRARPIVLAARAEARLNSTCSQTLQGVVQNYEDADD